MSDAYVNFTEHCGSIDGAPTLGSAPYYGTASELTPCFYYIQHTLVHLNTAYLGQ